MHWKTLHLASLAVLAGLLLIGYGNSFQGGFVQDSRFFVIDDSRVHAANARTVGRIFRENYWSYYSASGLYRPVTTLSYLFNYTVLGNKDRPFGYHLLNFLLHFANACLVYLLALRLLGDFRKAWLAAALWGLHPICTESVASIAGRPDELAALTVLGALLFYIRSSDASGLRKTVYLAAAAAISLVGVFSKENAVMVLGLAALYDITYVIRSPQPRRVEDWVWGYAALGLPILAMWSARSVVFRGTSGVFGFLDNPLVGANFVTSRITAIKVLGEYIWLLVWPHKLSCDYSYYQVPLMEWHFARWEDWKALIALVAILALAAAAVAAYRRSKAVFFFICFSGLTILPTANLFLPIGTIKAERFLYLPAIGFTGCLVVAVYGACGRLALGPRVAPALLCVIAEAFGARTFLRNRDWRDDEKLWTSALDVCPASYKTHLNLAHAWMEKDSLQIDWSIAEGERALAIVTQVPARLCSSTVHKELGAYYAIKGDAVAYKSRDGALFAKPDSSDWYRKSLQTLLRGVAIEREASAELRKKLASRGRPPEMGFIGSPNLYRNLGVAYLRLGDVPRALEALEYQRRIAPDQLDVYRGFANAYLQAGRTEDAIVSLLKSFLLRGPEQDLAAALELYLKTDPGGCAVVVKGDQRTLESDCPVVHRHLCAAYLDLVKFYPAQRRKSLELQARDVVHPSACPQ